MPNSNLLKPEFRIIVIDDNAAIHRDFIKILTTHESSEFSTLKDIVFGNQDQEDRIPPQFEIDTALQGKEGLHKIKKALKENRPYSLAFVDIRMPPGWDGVETIKRIWEVDKDIQIVICTAYSDYSWEETVEHLGNTDNLLILKKPFDRIAVRQLASALTRKWELMQESRSHLFSLEKKIEERTSELQYQATHDPLTGLPNRTILFQKIQHMLEICKLNKKKFAILFIDLDRFKLINDSFSHSVGDELLYQVAARLQTIISPKDLLARLGGDEFIITTFEFKENQKLTQFISEVLTALAKPFQVLSREVVINCSIGVSVYPQDGDTADILLRNADAAMYYAKESGGNQFQFYTKELNDQSLKRLDEEAQLRLAIENSEFFLCYQPQVDLFTEKLIAVEALIRWRHPQKGIIYPMDFIPLAEETGLIVSIGEWALRTACAQNKKWQDDGLPPIRMAVNFASQQFRQKNIVEVIKNILAETKLKPEYLEIEVTENVIIRSSNIINTIIELKKIGVQVALDDFGTGCSSLSYLKRIPLDRLKIDQSFIQNIMKNKDDEVIVRAIIAMANNLNLDVLAEGVENKKQLNFLKLQDCSQVQGYLFSEALPAEEIKRLLEKSKEKQEIT